MKQTMYAGVVHAKDDIRYEQIEIPQLQDDEVLVKVKYTGICGSDVPRVHGDACHFFPNVLGHEFSGTVVETGNNVTKVMSGMRIAGIPLVPCMKCEDCKKGNYSLCKHYSFIGSRRFGSFAEYVAVPETNVFPIGDNVSFKEAALFEPSTIALHAIRLADYRGGKTAGIVGCGTIGILTAQWASIMGASKVVVIGRSKDRLPLALEMGATDVLSTLDEDYYDRLMGITNGRGLDYVFDATGNADMMKEELRLAANRGTVCMIGTPKKEIAFSVQEWEQINRKELYLTGSWMSYSAPFPGEEWQLTADYSQSGRLNLNGNIVDRIFGLSEIKQAFELFRLPGEVKGKILIDSER